MSKFLGNPKISNYEILPRPDWISSRYFRVLAPLYKSDFPSSISEQF